MLFSPGVSPAATLSMSLLMHCICLYGHLLISSFRHRRFMFVAPMPRRSQAASLFRWKRLDTCVKDSLSVASADAPRSRRPTVAVRPSSVCIPPGPPGAARAVSLAARQRAVGSTRPVGRRRPALACRVALSSPPALTAVVRLFLTVALPPATAPAAVAGSPPGGAEGAFAARTRAAGTGSVERVTHAGSLGHSRACACAALEAVGHQSRRSSPSDSSSSRPAPLPPSLPPSSSSSSSSSSSLPPSSEPSGAALASSLARISASARAAHLRAHGLTLPVRWRRPSFPRRPLLLTTTLLLVLIALLPSAAAAVVAASPQDGASRHCAAGPGAAARAAHAGSPGHPWSGARAAPEAADNMIISSSSSSSRRRAGGIAADAPAGPMISLRGPCACACAPADATHQLISSPSSSCRAIGPAAAAHPAPARAPGPGWSAARAARVHHPCASRSLASAAAGDAMPTRHGAAPPAPRRRRTPHANEG